MAVPKSKITRSKRNMRRSHHRLSAPSYVECPNCGDMQRPHHICASCGYYRNREMVEPREAD
ncbi:MAG: 50S ribosomal protein L32 [Pseudomonadota bacterium]